MPVPNLSRDLVAEEIRTDREERSVVARINTDHLDRFKTVILPKGAILKNYRQNPVVLWAHDYHSPPIGRNVWIKTDEHALIAKTIFADTSLAEEVLGLYAGEFLRAFSIGFSVPRGGEREPTEKDLEERPDWAGVELIYHKWELLEYSCVPIPGNPAALVLAMEQQQLELSEPMLRSLGIDEGDSVEDPPEEMRPYPNEHACRLRQPGDFDSDSFKRVSRKHGEKTYGVIQGTLKETGKRADQSFRYPTSGWEAAAAKEHCSSHKGIKFEPATGGKQLEQELAVLAERINRLEQHLRQPSEEEVRRAVTNLIKGTQLGSLLQEIDLKRLISGAIGEVVAKLQGRV